VTDDDQRGDRENPVPLLEPRDGMPPVVITGEALAEAISRLAGGTGPLAVDAERASGYRYGQRAYLVQLRRAQAGTVLIDPIACPDLSGLDTALADSEAVLHAASQDLPCLAEIGYRPRRLFDTELAGRLLGYGSLAARSGGGRRLFPRVRHLPYPEQLYIEVCGLIFKDPGGDD